MVWDTTYSLFQQCALGLSVHILVYDRNFGFGSVVRPNKSFDRVRWFGRNTVSVNRTDYRTFRHWLLEISKPKRKSNFSTRKICFWRKKWDKLILTTNLVPRRFNLQIFAGLWKSRKKDLKKGYVVKFQKWVYPRLPHEKSFYLYILLIILHFMISRIYARKK